MVAEIPKDTAYIVGRNTEAVSTVKGYTVLSASAVPNVYDAKAYALGVVGVSRAGVSVSAARALLVNPASVTDSTTYALATMALREAGVSSTYGYAVAYTFYPPYEDLYTEYSFIERQFPTCVSFGSSGGPGFKTSVFEVDSGLTTTEVKWDRIRARYDANFDHVSPENIAEVENFFYGVKGRAIGFRYKDWSDYTISQQNILVGDGTTQHFQIFKRYTSGGYTFDRIIRKPIKSSFTITLDGVELVPNQDYLMNDTTGNIFFPVPPPANSLGTIIIGEFDVPVRFDSDQLDVSYDDFQQLNIGRLPMIEVLT